MKRRIIIHTDDTLKPVYSSIECDLIRYLSGEIIGVIDKSNSGKTVQDVIGFGGDIPIAATLDEFLTLKPNYLLIGASSFKGTFPMEWYPMIIKALQMRVHILNGLHQPLNSLAEFDLLAKKYKARIVDLRETSEKPIKFKNLTSSIQAKKILIAATNNNSGKLATTIELLKTIHKNGYSADWIATGLASRLIKGKGFIAESILADLVSGYVENELYELDQKFEFLLIESQGTIKDPIKAGTSISILHGTGPDAVIICFNAESVNDVDEIQNAHDNYKAVLKQISKAKIIGISLNTSLLSAEDSQKLIKEAHEKLRIPVIDPLTSDLSEMLAAIKAVEK